MCRMHIISAADYSQLQFLAAIEQNAFYSKLVTKVLLSRCHAIVWLNLMAIQSVLCGSAHAFCSAPFAQSHQQHVCNNTCVVVQKNYLQSRHRVLAIIYWRLLPHIWPGSAACDLALQFRVRSSKGCGKGVHVDLQSMNLDVRLIQGNIFQISIIEAHPLVTA